MLISNTRLHNSIKHITHYGLREIDRDIELLNSIKIVDCSFMKSIQHNC